MTDSPLRRLLHITPVEMHRHQGPDLHFSESDTASADADSGRTTKVDGRNLKTASNRCIAQEEDSYFLFVHQIP